MRNAVALQLLFLFCLLFLWREVIVIPLWPLQDMSQDSDWTSGECCLRGQFGYISIWRVQVDRGSLCPNVLTQISGLSGPVIPCCTSRGPQRVCREMSPGVPEGESSCSCCHSEGWKSKRPPAEFRSLLSWWGCCGPTVCQIWFGGNPDTFWQQNSQNKSSSTEAESNTSSASAPSSSSSML